jgi:hypothetical protein
MLGSKSFIFLMVSYVGRLFTSLYGRDRGMEAIPWIEGISLWMDSHQSLMTLKTAL